MKIIDVTIDLETCSLAANAAVMQVSAVAWNRHATDADELFVKNISAFDARVDLRSCVMDGFDFDRETIKWWSNKPQELKDEITNGDCYPIKEVFEQFAQWMTEAKEYSQAVVVCLWAQGADFDIAILRHVLNKYGIKLPIGYRDFRDARTFIAEVGSRMLLEDHVDGIADHGKVYAMLPDFPEKADVHNALFDAKRTTWSLWHVISSIPDRQ